MRIVSIAALMAALFAAAGTNVNAQPTKGGTTVVVVKKPKELESKYWSAKTKVDETYVLWGQNRFGCGTVFTTEWAVPEGAKLDNGQPVPPDTKYAAGVPLPEAITIDLEDGSLSVSMKVAGDGTLFHVAKAPTVYSISGAPFELGKTTTLPPAAIGTTLVDHQKRLAAAEAALRSSGGMTGQKLEEALAASPTIVGIVKTQEAHGKAIDAQAKAITALQTALSKKADAEAVANALADKANASAVTALREKVVTLEDRLAADEKILYTSVPVVIGSPVQYQTVVYTVLETPVYVDGGYRFRCRRR